MPENPNKERGDFGMPILGSTGAGYDVTHPPVAPPLKKLSVFELDKVVTHEAQVIVEELIPEFQAHFLEKNKKYAAVQKGYDLGPKGVIPDLNRKVGILVDRLWHENPTVGEGTEEVINDLIGHLFLMLAQMRISDG